MPETIAVPAVGSRIPDIPLIGTDGTRTRLSAEIAGRPAVLFFMRAADCAICAGHARALGRMAAAGELAGALALVIAPGDESEARKAQSRVGSDVVVRASGDHHADLGLGRFMLLQHSGTFVVDDHGDVRSAVTSALPTASFSRAKLLEAVTGLDT